MVSPKVLYEEDYTKDGGEYRRKITCCVEAQRQRARWIEIADKLYALRDAITPSFFGSVRIEVRGTGMLGEMVFCPYCGNCYSK